MPRLRLVILCHPIRGFSSSGGYKDGLRPSLNYARPTACFTVCPDKMPEEVLEDVFKYLKSLTTKSAKEIRLSQNIGKILKEDKNLLERLAQ